MSQIRTHYLCPIYAAERDYVLDDYIQIAFSISPSVRDIQYHHLEFQSDDPEMQPRGQTRHTAQNQPVQFRFDLEGKLPNGRLVIELENMQDRPSALWMYHSGELPPPVLALRPSLSGKKLLATQTFRDLFRSEVINRDLFTDLKGSTAMYEQIGDAKAYFLVHQHFDALSRVIGIGMARS